VGASVANRSRCDGDRATGESYCIAHHLFSEDGERKLMLAHLRYGDTLIKRDGAWRFAERNLYVDWIETSPRIRGGSGSSSSQPAPTAAMPAQTALTPPIRADRLPA
jgi:SnoaL-like domain